MFDQLTNTETKDLLKLFVDTSEKITVLRDTPFCTLRQLDELQQELTVEQIFLNHLYKELITRTMTEEEAKTIQEYLNN